jgi:hypothetical protein
MINPVLGEIGHRNWWYGEDKKRDTEPGEVAGLWTRDIVRMCEQAGFKLVEHERFLYSLNNLYLAVKPNENSSLEFRSPHISLSNQTVPTD